MTQRTAILFSLVLAISTLTGCMESATLIRVGKDGSGTITHRMYMSSDMMDMMQGMASGMMGAAEEAGADMPEIDPLADMKASLKDQFGAAATLEGTKDVVNAAGWKGVEANYKFANINDLDMTTASKSEEDGAGMQPGGPTYKFVFTPGDTATLKLVPLGQDGAAEDDVPAAETTAGAGDAEPAEPGMEMEGMDAMGNMGMQMMAPMLKGMRMSLLVAVDGKVVESNASFPHPSHPNVVTLADIDFDKLLAHPDGMKALQAGPDANPADLAKLGIDGVTVEDPSKEVVIRFE